MKNKIVLFVMLLLTIASCSTKKEGGIEGEYKSCLPKLFSSDLSQLVNSFDKYLDRNHDGESTKFITALLNREFPEKHDFNKYDSEVAQTLRNNNFNAFIYTEYEENWNDSAIEISPPGTANDSRPPSRKRIKIDLEKPYLNCLSSINSSGDLIKNYINLHQDSPSLSPLVIGKMFVDNKSDKDYATPLVKTIIAVELYYMILNAATANPTK